MRASENAVAGRGRGAGSAFGGGGGWLRRALARKGFRVSRVMTRQGPFAAGRREGGVHPSIGLVSPSVAAPPQRAFSIKLKKQHLRGRYPGINFTRKDIDMVRMVLNDQQWEKIAPMLPGKASDCGVTAKNNRLFLEAVLWINRTGAPWRDLPAVFGLWHRVYVRYNRWAHKGTWKKIFEALARAADVEFVHIDATITRVHQHGASPKKNAGSKAKAEAGVV